MQSTNHDFAMLYRAAFAERDPDRKSGLLRQVQQVLQSWHQSEEGFSTSEPGDSQRSRFAASSSQL